MLVIDDSVRDKFGISVGIAEIQGVTQKKSSELSKEIANVEEEIRARYSLDEVKNLRLIRMQRDFFWRLGVDPTKIRPASEALMRRILLNNGMPRISPVVDASNLASVKTQLTFSAFDLERIEQPLSVRFSKVGEIVTLIGDRKKVLTGKEIVLTDSSKILCVYAHGDVDETKVSSTTRDLLLVAYGIPGISKAEIEESLIIASKYIKRFAGGKVVIEEF
jgi:DNA/RNA-binding domain of Phe-tRNA-synthetase-like protein